MTSVNCARCGSMNLPTDRLCFKCGSPLQATSRIDSLQQPYFPPPTHGMDTIWRNKSVLIMTKQALLPGRCVKCNTHTDERLKRKLTWHHPALYLLILASILIYAIVALVVRKTATVDVGFCPEHLAARKRSLAITWGLGLLAVGSFVLGGVMEEVTLILASVPLILATAIYGIVTLRVVVPAKIDEHLVWLKGVNTDYLQEFPDWRGAR